MLDWSATAAWVALIVSIVSAVAGPLITTILSNRHQLKLLKIELYQKRKMEAIENYLKVCSSYIGRRTIREETEYLKAYGEIFLFAPKSTWESIERLDFELKKPDFKEAERAFHFVSQKLSHAYSFSHQK